jgi:hypothetical protein
MRSRLTAAIAALAMLGLAPSFANAEDVQTQLQQMQQQMQKMQDQLQATNDQLKAANQRVDAQTKLIQDSGLAETRGATNGLPGFLGSLTINGWVAGSYNYNLNDPNDHNNPNGGLAFANGGATGQFYPLHPDQNSFSLDQVWFGLEREVSEDNRAGFRADLLIGNTAKYVGGSCGSSTDVSCFYVDQAYVHYLAPVANGIDFKFGKFDTPIGVEVLATPYNWNITRGDVWSLLEPINHIGIQMGGKIGESGFDWMIGGVNGFAPDSPDINDGKSVIGHLGWSSDKASVGLNTIWGPETFGYDGDQGGVVNLLLKWMPSEKFSMYLNSDFDYMNAPQGTGLNPYAFGFSLAGRYAITDRTGIALRGEYVKDHDGFLACSGLLGGLQIPSALGVPPSAPAGSPSGSNCGGVATANPPNFDNVWGVTATVDHLLTDQLMIRGEARYDNVDITTINSIGNFNQDSYFNQNSHYPGTAQDYQVVLAVEVIYNFNKFGGQ